jgi:hypothetical protein
VSFDGLRAVEKMSVLDGTGDGAATLDNAVKPCACSAPLLWGLTTRRHGKISYRLALHATMLELPLIVLFHHTIGRTIG